ncbi:3-hydroxylacyl-ACP dehydratase [Streptomyces sp. NBC_01264]|uniref:3-hydroxylacyl-ACP dehydratase n=1 Tax=Streptomyces sp. NBC_01264 TaxID=2903804 RepID=UPI0022553BD9|nr:3-hydroxylacyl-ACP dehydratase [Streptomyces sp. NBC_01264]MCX4783728.1 3-hydroxylacyl-ACP dehydratase [Streptomyces sp. NBC_01264]
MRFHLIDRIETWTPRERITARKVTTVDEDYWQDTANGPALPFGLALEALCQSATWLIMLSTDHTLRAALLAVGEATAHRPVVPGEVLRMEARIESMNDDAAILDGTVTVDGETVLEASGIMCALIDAERLDDPANTARMARQLQGGGPVG